MAVSSAEYLGRFFDAMDAVESGSRGAVSDDRWLAENYSGEFLPLLEPYIRVSDEAIAYETILLLANVRERSISPEIDDLFKRGKDSVRMACAAYIKTMDDDDELIPKLFDGIEHNDDYVFFNSASKLAKIARAEDMPRVRRTYGHVQGKMRLAMREVIKAIIRRNPSMEGEKWLYLSVPVAPDENSFDRFLAKSKEYIDVRYRSSVFPRKNIRVSTYNNVRDALMTIRKRLYNEEENLRYYDIDKSDRFEELSELAEWASIDLLGKTVLKDDRVGWMRLKFNSYTSKAILGLGVPVLFRLSLRVKEFIRIPRNEKNGLRRIQRQRQGQAQRVLRCGLLRLREGMQSSLQAHPGKARVLQGLLQKAPA